ncbi:hypothetical protein F0562_015592 [Nyssa sinensis]|uniref:Uncharacterized protein n=1 Tax=Nyssa sinensis TaxID=561372 RepID=A0A5J4ZKN0_9ASTE|nr:hypothetical protein F0562_015592 [Nyssa sinensis]
MVVFMDGAEKGKSAVGKSEDGFRSEVLTSTDVRSVDEGTGELRESDLTDKNSPQLCSIRHATEKKK